MLNGMEIFSAFYSKKWLSLATCLQEDYYWLLGNVYVLLCSKNLFRGNILGLYAVIFSNSLKWQPISNFENYKESASLSITNWPSYLQYKPTTDCVNLRILASYKAKTVKISNHWTSRPVENVQKLLIFAIFCLITSKYP